MTTRTLNKKKKKKIGWFTRLLLISGSRVQSAWAAP